MRILFIAPLPPPVTGHSLASLVLRDALAPHHTVDVVDLSVGSANDGSVSTLRIVEVLRVLWAVLRKRNADVIYLTIAESVAGNIKDLLIYLLCVGRLSRVCIHLHGGTIGRELFERRPLLRWLNAAAIGRVGAVVISGDAHRGIFAAMIGPERTHLVPNFAQEQLFVSEAAIRAKFSDRRVLRVLYLSGMTTGKGYRDLADAYRALPAALRARITVEFAGRFDHDEERRAFEAEVADEPGMTYHGFVDDATKQRLFAEAHVFCLPSAFFEGQPISILEAYASGCLVIATGQAGIRDVFRDGTNGFEIAAHEPTTIGRAFARIVDAEEQLEAMALGNRAEAGAQYRTATFTGRMRRILEALAPSATR